MQTTTIKLDIRTKEALDNYKRYTESYAQTIQRLLDKDKKERLKELLIEGYKKRSKEQLKEYYQFENVSKEVEYDEF